MKRVNWKGREIKRMWHFLRHCPALCGEELNENTIKLNQDYPFGELGTSGSLDYEAGVLANHDVRSTSVDHGE